MAVIKCPKCGRKINASRLAEKVVNLLVHEDFPSTTDGQIWPVWIAPPAESGLPNYHLKNQPVGLCPSRNTYYAVRDYVRRAVIAAMQKE